MRILYGQVPGYTLVVTLLCASCVAPDVGVDPADLSDEPESIGSVADALSVSTNLLYEGSCGWLACASEYCGYPGCGGQCSDTQPWLARPDQSIACGTMLQVCNRANGLCVNAPIRDTNSPGGYWEGNRAVFQAIGATYVDGVCNCAPCTGIYDCQGATWGSGSASVDIVTGAIVDDKNGGFTKYGPAAYWWQAGIGYGARIFWTYVNGSTQGNYARWKPVLPSAGTYAVSAFVPSNHATSQQAKYRIYHNGQNHYFTINQNYYYDAWVSLGSYYFSASGAEYVELSDATGEAPSTNRQLGFDAMRFAK